eukprot:TRINITY_DN21735_c0_g1_i2.p1 TRINITY_DN21735_c0_g1~~TRINITY_DN21735_c0_g1_i2.p1  ORF type:complete len:278 (-),score=55.96 TRINITY_DN21735_c0_g1_i2:309-1142(-)
MGKVSPKEKEPMALKQKRSRKARNRQSRTSSPAQHRFSRVTTRSCTDIGKKRILVLDSENVKDELLIQAKVVAVDHTSRVLSPERPDIKPMVGLLDGVKQQNFPGTPKTPRAYEFSSESRLESLPMDLLVKILCHLHHDQLRAVFHVSHRISEAVILARKWHFDYTTPDRARQEMLRTKTPLAYEHWPFGSKGHGKGIHCLTPHTPKAPKHGPRPPSRLKGSEVRQVAAVLFQERTFSSRWMMPPGLPRPPCKSLGSSRVLFYEEELCQAVAQNKLL